MRPTVRLLANVKPGRFLEAGTPTGLTGLFTHDAPRSTLMYIYSSTLDKLQALPETSVYRQSAESLTKHRLKIVESIKPAKYEQWAEKAKATIAANPEVFNTPEGGVDHEGGSFGKHVKSVKHGRTFVTTTNRLEPDEREEEWDGETVGAAKLEGPRSTAERTDLKDIGRMRPGSDQKTVMWETEPPLEASQIAEMENQLGGGLIEEVIQVAEGELKLVDVMAESKVWEELEDKAPQGQWEYFGRETGTEAPPTESK
ncbi:MAG: hypothetical protein FRX48_01586 [Lasallia pustulata]|uniref:ETC complex I subunit n=1 Tax=Lasallia pustulata TaxID=136370 RepID=A0A1W5D333_9LECA|nr:MAG: hypothetical protein FRX48_01586 [Lasallia pustulata]SLM37544.1 ETC complex I subunit [Lasallia pustulata]